MIKYKLIQKYPGSPKLGFISSPHISQSDNTHYYGHTFFNPEDYPKFWEKVAENYDKFKPPFRVGKAQHNTVLDSLGHVVATFTNNSALMVSDYINFLNYKYDK